MEHPTDDELRDYILGLLDESRSIEIDQHLAVCERCTNRIEQITPVDESFVSVVQSAWNLDALDSSDQRLCETTDPNHVTLGLGGEHSTVLQAGKYQVIEELGRGGMGVVYKALDTELKREVALKVILAGEHSSGTQRERFRREAETIARLRHPGIVQIYEVGDFNEQPFLALELVAGPDLSSITLAQPQPVKWSASLILQLSQAIHYAHQQSIIHRDLKPGNVLVSLVELSDSQASSGSADFVPAEEPNVPLAKITDFGLAKQLDSEEQMTKTGHAMGTPAYMSPEQAAGNLREVGPPTDIYALGAILYELLAGQPPIRGSDPVSTMIAVIEQEPESIRVLRREIPRDLETICMKCLMKRPQDRYESAKDLGHDLELFLAGEPILARPLNILRRAYRWARNHPQLAIAYLTCMICYGIHLVSRHILKVPFHAGSYGVYLPLLLIAWAGLTTACEVLARRFERVEIGQYVFMGITIIWMSAMFSIDSGPRTPPINYFYVLIASTILIVPKSSMIWFVTLMCSVAYTLLALHANLVSGRGAVGLDDGLAFVGSLLTTGFCMQLILRRATRRKIRDDQWKSGSGRSSHVKDAA